MSEYEVLTMRITEKEIARFKEIGWQFFWYHPGDDMRYVTRAPSGEVFFPVVGVERATDQIIALVEWR